MDKKNTIEKGSQTLESTEALTVKQPDRMAGMQELVETIDLLATVSEKVGENTSENWSGGSGGTGDGDDTTQQKSARVLAIERIPSELKVRAAMTVHIENEVKKLRKEVRKLSRKTGKPGGAYQLNEMYSRIRRLNSLLAELVEASFDLVKRLYIKVFIDKQKVM